jgi:hypothetical protein
LHPLGSQDLPRSAGRLDRCKSQLLKPRPPHFSPNIFGICSCETRHRKPFRICTCKTKFFILFGICTYNTPTGGGRPAAPSRHGKERRSAADASRWAPLMARFKDPKMNPSRICLVFCVLSLALAASLAAQSDVAFPKEVYAARPALGSPPRPEMRSSSFPAATRSATKISSNRIRISGTSLAWNRPTRFS